MANNAELIKQCEERAQQWLTPAFDEETRKEVKAMLDAEDKSALVDAFYQNLEFGTGGLRGIMGAGTNRMNKYIVGMATQGFANYILKAFPGEENLSVVVGHDCRNNSRLFAETVAAIFSANGIKAYLFESLRPTPEISFAIRELGAVVGGAPVARLTDVSSLKLEVKVPESDIIYFSEGAEVSVHNELFKDTRFSGKIDFVSDRGDESHNYVVKARVMNNSKVKLKAGMFGSISLNKKMDVKSLLIPRSALLGSAKKPQVYVVDNGKAMLREVTPGRSNTTEIEVLSGLKAGESVVVSGQINLVDGSNVQVAK
jgi:hypothetical protein